MNLFNLIVKRIAFSSLVIALFAGAFLDSGNAQPQGVQDVIFCLDVSKSMLEKSKNEQFDTIFEQVQDQIVQDIRSRRNGDNVSIWTFGGPPQKIITTTIEKNADKKRLIARVSALKPIASTTYLYRMYDKAIEQARQRAKKHPNNYVEIRVYTDGMNAGAPPKPNLQDILEKCDIVNSDVPNLEMTHLVYMSENDPNREQKEREINQLSEHHVRVGDIDDHFVRVVPYRLEFGNLQPHFKSDFTLLFYNTSGVEDTKIEIEPQIRKPSIDSGSYSFDVIPRPVDLGSRRSFSFEAVGSQTRDFLKGSGHKEFEGTLQFRIPNDSNVKFIPRQLSFKFSNVEPRSLTLGAEVMNMEGWAFSKNRDFWIGPERSPFYANLGASPVFIKFEVLNKEQLIQGDQVKIQVQADNAAIKGFPIGQFVNSRSNVDDVGKRTFTIDRKTEEFYLRLRYQPEFLKHINKDGTYAINLAVSTGNPNVSVKTIFRGNEDVAIDDTKSIVVLPAKPDQLPCEIGDCTCIKPPPPDWLRWVAAGLLSLFLLIIFYFGLRVPLSSAIILSVVYLVGAGLWGNWFLFLVYPAKYNFALIWGIAVVLHFFFPAAFSVVPLLGGWRIIEEDARQTRLLRKLALRKGVKGLGRHFKRNKLMQAQIFPEYQEHAYSLQCNPILPGRLFIKALGADVKIRKGDQMIRLEPPGKHRLKDGEVYECSNKMYRVYKSFL